MKEQSEKEIATAKKEAQELVDIAKKKAKSEIKSAKEKLKKEAEEDKEEKRNCETKLQEKNDRLNTKIVALCSFYCDEIEDFILDENICDFNQITSRLHELDHERILEMQECSEDN